MVPYSYSLSKPGYRCKMSSKRKRHVVLMVDDDPDDILLMRDAIKEVAPSVKFKAVHDGQEMMDYLSVAAGAAQDVRTPCPELILLDLRMPKKSGFEVLDEVKRDSVLRGIPVVILSTSTAEQDIDRSYSMGANTFIPKPQTYDELLTVMSQTMNYWFGISRLPSICSKNGRY